MKTALMMLALCFLFVGLYLIMPQKPMGELRCEARWKDSGYAFRHSYLGGCQVQMSDGRWIPEEAYREVR